MKIKTHFWAKPIPDRSFDWCRYMIGYGATDDDTYDGAEDSTNRNMIGYGATEAEAIADLERLLQEESEYREQQETAS
jgi:hypothetical protein